jgi:hypothetical protein
MGIGGRRRGRHHVPGVRISGRLGVPLSLDGTGLTRRRRMPGVWVSGSRWLRHLMARMRASRRRSRGRGRHGVAGVRGGFGRLSEGGIRRTGEKQPEERGSDHAAAPCIGRTLNS